MTCPVCKSPSAPRYRPFCSRRCADIDLAKWMRGAYAIASEDPPDEEDIAELERPKDAPRH